MTHITKSIACITASCIMMALSACNGNNTSNYTRCEDSLAMYTKTAPAHDTAGSADTTGAGSDMNTTGSGSAHGRGRSGKTEVTTFPDHEMAIENAAMAAEPTGPGRLRVSSSAFANLGVIPVKYTCDGSGVTPPFTVTNIPSGTASLALIVHDYNATPESGFTYWIIWNMDTVGVIPENFHSDHEAMNAAKEYGNTPICARAGNHRYHFIFYALDTKLVIGKTTTKASIERVMRGHVLGKGELVGIYNKRLE